ncbi:MAG: DUF485 domain-containing protein [Streptosporangiales bacterium]|nr:DUF485 domain-containing protein [Streptosporangiales bacterium]
MSGPQQRASAEEPEPDWDAIANSVAFRQLTRSRRRFVVVALVIALGWFAVFLGLVCYAPGVMGAFVYRGLTVGYLFGTSVFVVAGIMTFAYLRLSRRSFTGLEEAARNSAGAAVLDEEPRS